MRLVRTYLERERYRVIEATDGRARSRRSSVERRRSSCSTSCCPRSTGCAVIRAVRRTRPDAGHHPVGARPDRRPDRRPRGRRGRLPAEAVLAGRAGAARPAGPRADGRRRPRRSAARARAADPARRPGRRPRPPRGPDRRSARSPLTPSSSGSWSRCSRRTAGCSPATSCSTRSTARTRPSPRPDDRRPHRAAARQARRRRGAAALHRDGARRRLPGAPATRCSAARDERGVGGIAGADRAGRAGRRAASRIAILALGVVVVGGQTLRRPDGRATATSAESRRAMFDDSRRPGRRRRRRSWPSSSAVGRRRSCSARMLARPLGEIGGAARRIAEGDYARARPARGPGGDRRASPTRSTRWPPRSRSRSGCAASSSPTPPTSCGRR